MPIKHRELNPHITLLCQDQNIGRVIEDKDKYTEKCRNILNTKPFCKLQKGSTKTIEMRIQRAARKIKNKLSPNEYVNIYRTDSSPEKFHRTAKKHKITLTRTIDYISIPAIISNIGTALH